MVKEMETDSGREDDHIDDYEALYQAESGYRDGFRNYRDYHDFHDFLIHPMR